MVTSICRARILHGNVANGGSVSGHRAPTVASVDPALHARDSFMNRLTDTADPCKPTATWRHIIRRPRTWNAARRDDRAAPRVRRAGSARFLLGVKQVTLAALGTEPTHKDRGWARLKASLPWNYFQPWDSRVKVKVQRGGSLVAIACWGKDKWSIIPRFNT